MNIIKYPTESDVARAISDNEPILALISFDGKTAIMSHIDEAVEHHILLLKAGFSDRDIDKYFRIILDRDGADWTFICPTDYKNISDRQRRIAAFYKDGFSVISDFLTQINFMVGIGIPRRYRRHLEALKDD